MAIKLNWKYKIKAFVKREFSVLVSTRRVFLKILNRLRDRVDALQGKFFHSQFGEDREVYRSFFSRPQFRNGFYVELGAADGIENSNTKFFQDFLGWHGLLIEPVPEQFEKLKLNRPQNILVNAAVSEKEGDVEFLGVGCTAGMVHTMAAGHREIYHPKGSRSFLVKGIPFLKILSQCEVRSIDFLSIDLEGGELEALNTFDWDIPVHAIVIELDGRDLSKDEACRRLLITHGYKFFKKKWVSEIWHRPTYRRDLTPSVSPR